MNGETVNNELLAIKLENAADNLELWLESSQLEDLRAKGGHVQIEITFALAPDRGELERCAGAFRKAADKFKEVYA